MPASGLRGPRFDARTAFAAGLVLGTLIVVWTIASLLPAAHHAASPAALDTGSTHPRASEPAPVAQPQITSRAGAGRVVPDARRDEPAEVIERAEREVRAAAERELARLIATEQARRMSVPEPPPPADPSPTSGEGGVSMDVVPVTGASPQVPDTSPAATVQPGEPDAEGQVLQCEDAPAAPARRVRARRCRANDAPRRNHLARRNLTSIPAC